MRPRLVEGIDTVVVVILLAGSYSWWREGNTHLHARQLLDTENRLRHADRVDHLVQTLVDLLSPLLARVPLRSHRCDLALSSRVRLQRLQLLRNLLDPALLLSLNANPNTYLLLLF